MLYELTGVSPRLEPESWVAPSADVIGNVTLGRRSSIWFNCLVRGDTNRIVIGERTNIQDNSVLHVNPPEEHACLIGDDVTVGHMCIIHACRLENHAFVGMGATVLDGAVVEEGAMLAAGALLTPNKRIPRRELWGGRPARKMRDISDEDRAELDRIAVHYAELAQKYRAGLTPIR